MNALCKALAEPLDVNIATEIAVIERMREGWQLQSKTGEVFAGYDWVISSAPARQTHNLFPETFSDHHTLSKVTMTPCYSLMVGYEGTLPFHWEAAVVKDSPIAWMAANSAKPGRETQPSILVQTAHDWTEGTIHDDNEQVMALLIAELVALTGMEEKFITHKAIHGWLYAGVGEAADTPYLMDEEQGLAACGDWCLEGRVEAAFTSGHTLAQAIKTQIEAQHDAA